MAMKKEAKKNTLQDDGYMRNANTATSYQNSHDSKIYEKEQQQSDNNSTPKTDILREDTNDALVDATISDDQCEEPKDER